MRARAEGLGELGMGAVAAGGSDVELLLATGGFTLLGLVAAATCVLILAAAGTTRGHHRAASPALDPGAATRPSSA